MSSSSNEENKNNKDEDKQLVLAGLAGPLDLSSEDEMECGSEEFHDLQDGVSAMASNQKRNKGGPGKKRPGNNFACDGGSGDPKRNPSVNNDVLNPPNIETLDDVGGLKDQVR